MTVLIFAAVAVLVLFPLLFILTGHGFIDFWWGMSGILVTMITLIALTDRTWLKKFKPDFTDHLFQKIWCGLLSAAGLYLVFWIGDYALKFLFSQAGAAIDSVYGFKSDANGLRIAILMLLVIGPGEEILWRGFIQQKLQYRYGPWIGFAGATILYTVVHLASGNPVLMLAAAVCGLFWGYLYRRFNSLLLNIISHTVWDIAVFLLLPF